MIPDVEDAESATPQDRARAAAQALGTQELAHWCAEILTGELDLVDQDLHDPRWIAGRAWAAWGDPAGWSSRGLDHWPRTWAARTLLHAWDPVAMSAVISGLRDEAWRVREMCAKIAARYEVVSAAPECARCAQSDAVPRVRVAALRALAVVGEIEQVPAVLSALHHEDPSVVRAAERAVDQIEARLDRPLS
ncbi:HEAT repeat domain-containing protein [Brachybacterium sp. JB7]|uniref:HEAT repeat domain-containing protein n=1 Tax=Brachybacterium sp. JB7 TaxID=2024478 RepID=UPI000DF17274|nr:HEAT repeat domain-containing protein [Brachybacterium sp. JB7]RCS66193.1 HEAT repeat domain-containing protein [Brachybacterium sp. JB7]